VNHVDAYDLVDSWWNPWGEGEFWSCEWGEQYCYDVFTKGEAVMDNTLSMGELQGVTEDNKMFGEFIYGPGADGDMGGYEHINATTEEVHDYNDSYGVLPNSGIWELDLTTNHLVFFNSDKSKSTKLFIVGESEGEFPDLIANGVEILGNGFNGLADGWNVVDGKFHFFLEIDRSNLNDQEGSFYDYGFEAPWHEWSLGFDQTEHKINGGFALEFRME